MCDDRLRPPFVANSSKVAATADHVLTRTWLLGWDVLSTTGDREKKGTVHSIGVEGNVSALSNIRYVCVYTSSQFCFTLLQPYKFVVYFRRSDS